MLNTNCCDRATQSAISSFQSTAATDATAQANPNLIAAIAADMNDRSNWSYDPASFNCTWSAPRSYTLDDGSPLSAYGGALTKVVSGDCTGGNTGQFDWKMVVIPAGILLGVWLIVR